MFRRLAPAVQETLELPRGTRLRLDALPRCMVDEATLAAVGAEVACPLETRLGTGRAEGLANGAPVGFDLTVFAIGGRLFFAGSQNGVPLRPACTAPRRAAGSCSPCRPAA